MRVNFMREYYINGHIYDLSGIYPVCDDVVLRSRSSLKKAFFELLDGINYNFKWPRPVAPIITNWDCVRLFDLVRMFRKCVTQISDALEFSPDFPFLDWDLDFCGFVKRSTCDRLCFVRFEYQGLKSSYPLSLSCAAAKVNYLLSKVRPNAKFLITIS